MKRILALLLALSMLFALAACGEDNESTPADESTRATTSTTESKETSKTEEILENEEISETSEVIAEPTLESEMFSFINAFNASSAVQLVFAEDFKPSDKSNSHYRTEFRLSAYTDAIGKSYTYGESVVDIVGKQSWSGDITLRVYMDGATIEQCAEMVKHASPIMDPDIDSVDVQKTIDYINENKTANGYYYADLSLLLLDNNSKGYEFMLKMGND